MWKREIVRIKIIFEKATQSFFLKLINQTNQQLKQSEIICPRNMK